MSHVEIYRTESVDGQRGGTPHLHLACDEMYFGLSGQGSVELITWDGFTRVPISPGTAMVFTPGTIHRAINPAGDLEILVMMQNKGLPERGDVAICFPEKILGSPQAYTDAMKVDSEATAHKRRDLGVAGFLELKEMFARSLDEGRHALERFYRIAIERTCEHYTAWAQIVEQGPAAQVRRTHQILERLAEHSTESLQEGQFVHVGAGPQSSFGFCGHVHSYHPTDTHYTPEGTRKQVGS